MSALDPVFLKRRALRNNVLDYFVEAHKSYGMSELERFSQYTRDELHQAVYAYETSGLIHKIRGGLNNAIYKATDDGLLLLKTKG